MVGCFVPKCNHNNSSARHDCSFVTFPRNPALRKKWIDLIRRAEKLPTSASRVCSCHFPNHDTKMLPNIFEWSRNTTFTFQSPEKKTRKNRRKQNQNVTKIQDQPEGSTAVDVIMGPEMVPVDAVVQGPPKVTAAADIIGVTEMALEYAVMETQTEKVPHVPLAVTAVDAIKIRKSAEVQTDYIFSPDVYEIEIAQLKEEIKKLKNENDNLKRRVFNFQRIVSSEKLCAHFTGLSPKVVLLLAELLKKVATSSKFTSVTILNLEDQLLLTLTRLRRDLSCQDLADRFGIGVTTTQEVFTSILTMLHKILFLNFMAKIPSREKNQMFLADCFKDYPNTRIVLDCTEISCDIPHSMDKQRATFSSYKWYNTIKWLVGSGTKGEVTYCSKGYPGSTSDKALVQHSGLLSQMEPGDTILADKGFIIADILPLGVSLNIPPFLMNPQFTEDEVFEGRSISRGRIHIERINSRLKRFRILRHIPTKLFRSCDLLVQTCCALINVQNPLLRECDKFYETFFSDVNLEENSFET